MIKFFIKIAVIFFLLVAVLSIYLQPDDISRCGKVPSSKQGCQAVDAIVAISGGDTNARTKEAIELFKNGWGTKLILSGAAQDKTGPSNAAVMRTIAINSGVPSDAIILDEYSETTEQNAENSNKIFADNNIKKVILVTSGYHQRRAGLEFNKRTQNMIILNHPISGGKDWSFWWWITPTGWYLVISEIVKIIAFYILGIFG